MHIYAMMLHPGHNRVYFEASKQLALWELEACSARLEGALLNARLETLGGCAYLLFEKEAPLHHQDIAILATLSFAFALFERQGEALYPLELSEACLLGDAVRTILRYSGKTNEQFTRLLLNMGIAGSAFAKTPRLRVLDPLCGKGTTLYEAAVCGHDAYGVELSGKYVVEAITFFKKYLEQAGIVHTFRQERVRQQNGKLAELGRFAYAESRDALKAGDAHTLAIAAGDTAQIKPMFQKSFFHLVIGDLPYGVQHASQAGQPGFTRNPKELLEKSLAGWYHVTKPGGALVLGWNRFLLSRANMEALLEQFGYEVVRDIPFVSLSHRVDQAIDRDVVVAVKPMSEA